jgi:acetoin utilization protein AcuB
VSHGRTEPLLQRSNSSPTKPHPEVPRAQPKEQIMNEIKHFMTPSPHAIGHDQSLKLAHERMQHWGVRQLPVLEGGALVGVISERDIALVAAIAPAAVESTTVAEAMSSEPYAVAPDDDIAQVTEQMAEHGYVCAIVMEQHKAVGAFMTTDALHLLSGLLRGGDHASLSATDVVRALVPTSKRRKK